LQLSQQPSRRFLPGTPQAMQKISHGRVSTRRNTNAVVRKAAAAASEAAALSTAAFTDPPQLGKPRECKLAPRAGLPVSGTATMRHGQELWLLVRPPQEPTFYITSGAPLPVSASGNWSGDTQTLGAADDHGATFQLILAASSINASTILQRGYQTDGQVHTLPGGVDIIQTACVQRE
jgi:hypothetical protein